MIRRYAVFYFLVLTIPVFLGFTAWQSFRYTELEKDVRRLEAVQEDWVQNNKKLMASIAVLSSSSRIERVAMFDLALSKLLPENILQVRIEEGLSTSP